jgi:hypothetical protein
MHFASIGGRPLPSSTTADVPFRVRLRRIGRREALLPLHWLYCRWQLIRPAWFSVFIVTLVVFAFLNPQTGDVLIAAAADNFKVFMLFAGLLVFAVTAWYCARANLYVDYKLLESYRPGPHRWSPPMEPKNAEGWRRQTPRLLGVAAPVFVGAIYLRHAWAPESSHRVDWLGVGSLILAVALYIAFVHRRRGDKDRFAELSETKLPKRTFKWLFALLGTVAILLSIVAFLPLVWPAAASAIPMRLGAPFLFLLSAAFWLAFGSFVLVYPTYRFRQAPSLVLVAVLWAALMNWSPWRADDHRVRDFADDPHLTNQFTSWAEGRPDIRSQFEDWIEKRGEAIKQASTHRPYPVFILAAEGGGIRAAYWTAAVLAELEDRMPGFACHVFAISGVSGGSVGAAVYAGLIADKIDRGNLDCSSLWFKPPAEPQRNDFSWLLSRATRVLEQDFLAPTLAGMLYPDLVQRFLPASWLPDRATYLESAWETAFDLRRESTAGDNSDAGAARDAAYNWMSAPFHELWRSEGGATLIPSLFLNATQVETGKRVIVSNLRLEGEGSSFGDAIDAFAPDKETREVPIRAPIRLSTAAGLSARFIYLSPPARLHNGVHVVDGGYYDNSGVLTAHDILRALDASIRANEASDCSTECKIRPVVITLVNSTFENDQTARGPQSRGWLAATFHETWAPLATVLRTRTARARHAEHDLKAELRKHVHRFGLEAGDPQADTFPLGWMLASNTLKKMRQRAGKAVCMATLLTEEGWLRRHYAWNPPAAPTGPSGPTAATAGADRWARGTRTMSC